MNRDEELSGTAGVEKRCLELYAEVQKGFENQRTRANDTITFWELYNSQLGPEQIYNGNSKIFVPIVKSAVRARVTRFTNQLFPQSGRYVDVITEDGDLPHNIVSLLEYYVRKTDIKTKIVRPLIVAGDVEGQYSVYVDWETRKRKVVNRKKTDVEVEGMSTGHKVDDVEETEIKEGFPTVEVLRDQDLLILPATANSVDDALAKGGSVTIKRRWSKTMIRKKIKDGDLSKTRGEALLDAMSKVTTDGQADATKKLAKAAGIQKSPHGNHAEIFETWSIMKIRGEHLLCRNYLGGPDQLLSTKRCPYWNDECPIVSVPQDKLSDMFKGVSPLADVKDLQIFANDMINEAADTAHYSAMPIIMSDPEKNPNIGSMVLGLAAIWQTDPNSTKFAEFPQMWKQGFEIVAQAKQEIFQILSVNPSMMPQSTGGKTGGKRNQAEVALEMQADILTAIDAVTVLDEGIMTPIIRKFAAYDQQFREDDVTIPSFGEMGVKARMETIEPLQLEKRYEFRWFGVESSRNAQQIQQQVSMLNVLTNIPPDKYPGYKLDIRPVIVQAVEAIYGPRLGGLLFQNQVDQLSISPEMENQLLVHGFDVEVHAMDDDPQHIQAHIQLLQELGDDPHGVIRAHIMQHQQQMQMKQKAQAQAMQGANGAPNRGQGPAPGGQAPGPRPNRGPAGTVHPDQMAAAGAPGMPRKM